MKQIKTGLPFLFVICMAVQFPFVSIAQTNNQTGLADRKYWLLQLDKIARPVMYNLANDSLKINMPVVVSKHSDNPTSRKAVAYLEVFSRTLSGIAPWLDLEGGSAEEIKLRNQYRIWAIKATENAVNPKAKDHVDWYKGGQPLVDASYLALSFLRCPWLWKHLTDTTKQQVVEGFKLTRKVTPPFQNWILFTGMIETFFCHNNMDWDGVRVEYGLRQFSQWYVGDGVYSDGPKYEWDYYNSYVMHPYLATILEIVSKKTNRYDSMRVDEKARAERYAIIQERLIAPDGSYPATGRSIVYRGAAFHHLADMAAQNKLPEELKPAQVRCALTAVIKKTMECPNTFNKEGWLNIGLCGSQPDLADIYNNTGSLYICTNILLPLGLPETDKFWTTPAELYTSQKIWSGQDVKGDHGIH